MLTPTNGVGAAPVLTVETTRRCAEDESGSSDSHEPVDPSPAKVHLETLAASREGVGPPWMRFTVRVDDGGNDGDVAR